MLNIDQYDCKLTQFFTISFFTNLAPSKYNNKNLIFELIISLIFKLKQFGYLHSKTKMEVAAFGFCLSYHWRFAVVHQYSGY